ncbi:glycosyltransferase [Amnibacterium sp. CER49]|uniref:glycosyltransferase n=1 Tax=Amnibacterium sp. CER49 TaxID=3039161 RepID=UPI002447C6EA|nr:nucleotide disphospho-sugar-binding domain-containing protein [Amnibacterium sp. CER49]MDH2445000.1 glycosyltransferase [Amnibacterium sp. CER49]
MSTALIVTTDMGGNLPPLLGVGAELVARGWDVVVHADDRVRSRAQAHGLRFEQAAGVAYDAAEDRTLLQALRDIPAFWADRARGRDAVALARRIGAEVAVVDVLLVGALAELEAAGIRTVVVVHSTWEGVRSWFGGPIGALLKVRGVDPARTLAAADRVLVASSPRLGRPFPMPANALVIGPVLQEVPTPAARPARPLALVSLSTVAFPGQREAFQRVLDAAAALPADVRAGTGRAVPAEALRPGANTTLEPLVDHGALMPSASVVVTHGGHATTVRALAHGLPLLLVPMHPMMDQPRIAKAVVAAGAGLAVPKSASADRIREALRRLLGEPAFAEAAGRLGAELVAADGRRRAADEVERVARTAAARTERRAAS